MVGWYFAIALGWLATTLIGAALAAFFTQSKAIRISVVVLSVLTLIAVFPVTNELLGRAKPVKWAWTERNVDEAEIRGVELREGDGIYVMLIVEGEPRLYKYEWDREFAQQILQAMADASGQGGEGQGQQGQGGSQGQAPIPGQGAPVVIDQPFSGQTAVDALIDAAQSAAGQGDQQGQQGQEGQAGSEGTEGSEHPSVHPRPPTAPAPKPR